MPVPVEDIVNTIKFMKPHDLAKVAAAMRKRFASEAAHFDLDEWLKERLERDNQNGKYWAKRWGCSEAMLSRYRSGESRMSEEQIDKIFPHDIPIDPWTYTRHVFPRMHEQFVRRRKTLAGWEDGGFDPCKRCGAAFENHTNPNKESYSAEGCEATGCTGYERWIRRGIAMNLDRYREVISEIPLNTNVKTS